MVGRPTGRAAVAKKAAELGALEVGRLSAPGLNFVGGVAGLALQVAPTGSRSWVLRIMVGAKRRELGLGGFPDVPLADARRLARDLRESVRAGSDPVAERAAAKVLLKANQALEVTFEQAAAAYIKGKADEWKNAKHAQQWTNTLATYAAPVFGKVPVHAVTAEHVLAVLEPIWRTKTETATRLRGRIETVLDFAATKKWRIGENPARWKGHLDMSLATPSKVATVEHHTALPINEVGGFMARLRKLTGPSARALEFLALTACRAGEVRGMSWAEVDLDAATWTIPAERMKMGKLHRVPLSEPALDLLRKQEKIVGEELVFPTYRGGQLSDMAMTQTCRRLGGKCVPHGMRSTFRDWVAERTNYAGDLAEMALAHTISNRVEAAYRRGDMFEKRRAMMKAWAAFVARAEVTGDVVSINSMAAA